MGMTLDEVLARFREEAQGDKAALGTRFERLVKRLLTQLPLYRAQFRRVWHWSELNLGHDTGIDLVAEDVHGALYGIQAKCYEDGHVVSKPDVDTFLSKLGEYLPFEGARRAFDHGLIFSTTDAWGDNAERALADRAIPVQVLTLSRLRDLGANWEALAGLAEGPAVAPKALRDYQREALAAAHGHYAAHDRGKLIMACGTGKTFTSLRLVEQETGGKGLVLFLVPSIALLNQTLVAWCDDAAAPLHAVCVCSDAQANQRIKRGEDEPEENPNALALPPTTRPDVLAKRVRYLREKFPDALTVVFSTYQSIAVVEEAQRAYLGRDAFAFDFAVCDEAHRTTGAIAKEEEVPAFTFIHDDAHVLARRRLYMTATPRLYAEAAKAKAKERSIELCSMDDLALYGGEIYRIGFGAAVAKGCLADYKVLVLTLPEGELPEDSPYEQLTAEERKALESRNDDGRTTAVKLLGCINALAKRLKDSPLLTTADGVPARRAVAFCRTIKTSKATTALFQKFAADPRFNAPLCVKARHVDGEMGALARNDALAWLKADGGPAACHLLTNVRCLSEGVDVPSLDAVLFLSKRNSQIDVVQSVGRVMRTAPGKRYGYIVIPVVIPADKDPEKELDNSDTFGVVWTVLNALRAHDDRFEATINKLRFDKPTRGETLPGPYDPIDPVEPPAITISSGLSGDEEGLFPNRLGEPGAIQDSFDLRFPEKMEQYRNLLYGRIVKNCGNRKYFERWAAEVAEIAKRLAETLRARCAEDPRAADTFRRFHALLQTAVYANVSEEDARVMLVQQRITGPIFDALFGGSGFTAHNPVSQALDHAFDLLAALDTEEDRRTLDRFYQDVRTRVGNIQSADGKLEIIRTLYDTFFATAFKTTVEKLGIVFTPIEAVDFILRSADGALRKYFGKRLSDKGVHILDPFTGTGTFIARLLQKDLGLIRDDDLYRKYTQELHANEIVLLSYYIAAVNIENVFHDRAGRKERYSAFPGIVFGDTFRMREVKPDDLLDDEELRPNSERILAQNNAPISVIVGNPPYSIGQKSANDNAQNEDYPWLNDRIETTYVANSEATNNKALYDTYIQAFRWSSDLLGAMGATPPLPSSAVPHNPRGGVLCYVTNGGWLDSSSGSGFRRCLIQEFDDIYCYNLRGNCNTSGEVRQREGDGIFGEGSRTPITVLLLVRLPEGEHHGNATIHYRDIGDYKTREEKLHDLMMYGSFLSDTWLDGAQTIVPNDHGDWINQRKEAFGAYIPLAPEQKFTELGESVFSAQALGVATNRDAWVYAFSRETLAANMEKTIACFNRTIGGERSMNGHEISWSTNLQKAHEAGKTQRYDSGKIRLATYRPFTKQWQYFDQLWNERRGVMPKLFPTGKRGENLVICVSGGALLITDVTPDLHFVGDAQCFPLYWYEERDIDLFGKKTLVRHDGVSDWILRRAERQYGTTVTKEEIFYYVYGFLHQPEDFKATSDIGRRLAALHLNYEALEPYPLEEKGDFSDTRVIKMKFGGKNGKDRSTLIVNNTLTLRGIPEEAYRYQVNGRSPIEWAVDRYQVRTDDKSGIVNDPNLWAPDNPRYIPDLIKRLVTLSIKSLALIADLPPFSAE